MIEPHISYLSNIYILYSYSSFLYIIIGTREIWIRSKETEGVQRKLVECENRLNTVMVSKLNSIMTRNFFIG